MMADLSTSPHKQGLEGTDILEGKQIATIQLDLLGP